MQTETIIVPESVLNTPPPPPPPLLPADIEQNVSKMHSNAVPNLAKAMANSFDISASDLVPTIEPIPNVQGDGVADLSKYCEICDISVTSEMHMRLHLNGAKHAKKLRQLGEPPHTDAPDTLSQCIMNEPTTTKTKRPKHMAPVENPASTDFSVFRTPSGQYYCQVCDLSVASELTLSQHFSSKRHIRTMSLSKRK